MQPPPDHVGEQSGQGGDLVKSRITMAVGGNRRLHGRCAASTLAEDFPRALKDLERARRLGLRGREAELWTYVAEAMSGSVSPEHALGGYRPNSGRPGIVSIPGHIAQGRDDYSTEYGAFLVYQRANDD